MVLLLKIPMVTNIENSNNQELVGFIWSIADKLRGPYRPPQYRRVMLPLIVLRRLDAVLEPTKKAVLEAKAKYQAMGLEGDAFEKAIAAGGHSVPSLKSQLEAIANSRCITSVNLRFRNY